MAEVYAYTPDIWLPLAATVCLAAIAAYSWRRRDVPAAPQLAACALFAALWGLGRTLVAAAAFDSGEFAPTDALPNPATLQLPLSTAVVRNSSGGTCGSGAVVFQSPR